MVAFDAKSARAKYACPMWIDAFLRKTLHLSAEHVGVYHLILYAMWVRRDCRFPDDDTMLARISRTSSRTVWRRKIRPVVEPFFEIEDGFWTNKRLMYEAAKTEAFLTNQSGRRRSAISPSDQTLQVFGQSSDEKLLQTSLQQMNGQHPENIGTNHDRGQSVGSTGVRPGSDQPKRPSIRGGGVARAREFSLDFREKILAACGLDHTGLTGHGSACLGTNDDMETAKSWLKDLRLTEDQAIAIIKEVMVGKMQRDGEPPATLRYFNRAMKRFAAVLAEPPLTPDAPTAKPEGPQNERSAYGAALDQFLDRIRSGDVRF